jgi:hypothetical protein
VQLHEAYGRDCFQRVAAELKSCQDLQPTPYPPDLLGCVGWLIGSCVVYLVISKCLWVAGRCMVCVMALQLGRAFLVLTPMGCSLYKGYANTSARSSDRFVALSIQ